MSLTSGTPRAPVMSDGLPLSSALIEIAPAGCPVHVVAASLRAVRAGDATRRFVSGWGASADEAQQRCLAEAAERSAGQLFGTEAIRRARQGELEGSSVSPPEILLFDPEQHRERRAWNARHAGFNRVPASWRVDREIDWVRSDRRLGTEEAWLPAGLCFLGHERDRRAGLPPANSSGLAAARLLSEAAVAAFLELVERDAVAIWWYNRLVRPRLEASREPLVQAYAEWSRSRGRSLHLLDLSHDLGIAVVAAVTHDAQGGSIALGFGAAQSTGEAARHAVGEAAQFESNLALIAERVARSGFRGVTAEARSLLRWARTVRLADHPQLIGSKATQGSPEQRQLDLAQCHALCRRAGLRFLALDLTRPEFKVPVARVIVPGLRPIWVRFAPGRLFEVPVRLGWLPAPLRPADLDPTPLMF